MSLREKAIKGGAILVGRQVVGIALSLVGVLFVTRVIGPREFGIYAPGLGITTFLSTFGTWGLDVYLLRKSERVTAEESDQAFTILFWISLAFTVPIVAFRTLIAGLIRIPEAGAVLGVLSIGIPFSLLAIPAIVKLDRELNFKAVAVNELVSQVLCYVFAVPLALRGAGAWAPVVGSLAQQVSLCLLSFWTAQLRPGWHWEYNLIRRMLGYGLSYSSSIWVWQLRNLVNPLIVGRFAGAEAVGFVALAIRIATLLSFAKAVTWRVALAALAKLGGDRERLCRGITEGMRLQAVAVGLPLAGFATVAPFVFPLFFGQRWMPALGIFPFIALSYLANSVFNLHASVLYLLQKNWEVTWFNCAHVALFASGAALLVPRLGLMGYGWAEIVALPSYLLLHVLVTREVGSPSYTTALIWFATIVIVFVVCSLGASVAYLGPLILLVPTMFFEERASLIGYAQLLLSRRSV